VSVQQVQRAIIERAGRQGHALKQGALSAARTIKNTVQHQGAADPVRSEDETVNGGSEARRIRNVDNLLTGGRVRRRGSGLSGKERLVRLEAIGQCSCAGDGILVDAAEAE